MTDRSDDAIATVLLTSRVLESDAKPLTARDLWTLVRAGVGPGALLREVPESLPGSLDAPRVRARLELRQAYAFTVERLEQAGISVLTAFDEGFPTRLRDRLGDAGPVLLYVAGDAALLGRGGVGIVGSRDVPEEGLEVTAALAREAVRTGRAVVSGCARGVDRAAMAAAFEVDGEVVGFPADGMSRLLRQRDTRAGILDGRVVLASPYVPEARFSVGNAMGRNKLIYATADLTVAVAAAEDSGGTWVGATEALKQGYGRVAVWTGPGAPAGNEALAAAGARRLATVEELQAALSDADEPTPEPSPEQLGLAV